jgi:CBS domain-containing protein
MSTQVGSKVRKFNKRKPARRPMKGRDIMVRDFIAVRPDTLVRDIATFMVEKHISGVPVLTDNGKRWRV